MQAEYKHKKIIFIHWLIKNWKCKLICITQQHGEGSFDLCEHLQKIYK
jgi:hypothetical protein